LEHQREDLVRGQSEKADAVRAAGVAEGVRASAEKRLQDLETALAQCQQGREQLALDNKRLATGGRWSDFFWVDDGGLGGFEAGFAVGVAGAGLEYGTLCKI
jgi:hypothetical protein